MSKLQQYHYVWLAAHPYRTEEWLRIQLKDSFDVHHIDGNHDNNVADNLILIEHGDHMFLHKSTRRLRQITTKGKKYKTSRYLKNQLDTAVTEHPVDIEQNLEPVSAPDGVWITCRNSWQVYVTPADSPEKAQRRIAEFSQEPKRAVRSTETW